MKIHIFRSEEVPPILMRAIAGILKSSKGPIDFIFDDTYQESGDEDSIVQENESDFNYDESNLKTLRWKEIFEKCQKHRQNNQNIGNDELVVLLTAHYNEQSWFSSWDPEGAMNFFVHTAHWDKIIEAESCYPVVYEIASLPVIIASGNNLLEVEKLAHMETRGCPMDYCRNKKEAAIRMRTADICPECRERLSQRDFDPAVARQIFGIFEKIRGQMLFRERYKLLRKSIRMEINKFRQELIFPDLNHSAIKLNPRQMTVYLFFLNHIKGVAFPYLADYIDELRNIYRNFRNDANYAAFNNALEAMAYNKDDTLSQIISKVNRLIRFALGPDIAENFIIQGNTGEPRYIALDRNLLSIK